ncbi:hypothetical protein L0337_24075 [candidate division KSB1 bacterium]|nr:hypothetical protein [candidate division KSB1 bacterium]
METTLVDDKKVEELVERTVQKHFKLAFENVEEVRKSPAVTLIRIEDRLDALEARIGRDMVTKAELTSTYGALKQDNASLRMELKDEIAKIRAEVKDEIWKVRFSIISLAILIILTNPKVIELIGKLFSLFKP